MGWTYAFERPADPKAELDGLLTWSDARGRRRVLDSAIVRLRVYYAARAFVVRHHYAGSFPAGSGVSPTTSTSWCAAARPCQRATTCATGTTVWWPQGSCGPAGIRATTSTPSRSPSAPASTSEASHLEQLCAAA